jgi:gluconolactonase
MRGKRIVKTLLILCCLAIGAATVSAQQDIPKGKLTKHRISVSKTFPGTEREYFVYVPAQYEASGKPACLMVFQDGGGYCQDNGGSKAHLVFDELIAAGEMPVTVGLFINPGVVPAPNDNAEARYNRSFEYDGMGDLYARFLIEEMIPLLEKVHGVKVSDDPNDRGICGASSGAIAAFTAAWERPDAFRRVYSMIGTYVGLRGGNEYPTLIRKMEPKPLRIFLEDGSNDLNIYGGDWWMANQTMQRALEWAGYEVTHKWGEGQHSHEGGAAIFPDAMRWLWKDWPKKVETHLDKRVSRAYFLEDGQGWELVSEGHEFTEGPAVNAAGDLFFTDIPRSQILKVAADGTKSVFAKDTGRANGLAFGPDAKLYACATAKNAIVAYDSAGQSSMVLKGVAANDLVVTHEGIIYCTEPKSRTVWRITGGQKVAIDTDAKGCNGIILSLDQTLLYVTDFGGRFVNSYCIGSDGAVTNKQAYFHMHASANEAGAQLDGMAVSKDGWLLVATGLGVQICDQPGRVNFIIPQPLGERHPSNVAFHGQTMYATCGGKVFKRLLKIEGARTWELPVKPPKPGL